MPKTSILLTGGTGFLGSNLLNRLVGSHDLVVLKRSFSPTARISTFLGEDAPSRIRFYDIDQVPLSRVFEENRFDVIVHCATNYGRRAVPHTEITEANLILPLHLLQLAEQHGVKAFINTDTILDKGVNSYSLSKKQFLDWMSQFFSKRIACINVALEHFYGPLDDRSKFVTRILLDLIEGAPEIELTPGQQKRDFIFIDDVVEAFRLLIEFSRQAPSDFYRFEVGSGEKITIREFVQVAAEITENRGRTRLVFGALPYRANEVMESFVDTSELCKLGWQPKVMLREGMARTIEVERQLRNAPSREVLREIES